MLVRVAASLEVASDREGWVTAMVLVVSLVVLIELLVKGLVLGVLALLKKPLLQSLLLADEEEPELQRAQDESQAA